MMSNVCFKADVATGMNLSRLKQRLIIVLCRSRILAVFFFALICTLCVVTVLHNSKPLIEIITTTSHQATSSKHTHAHLHDDLEDLVARSMLDNKGKYRIISYVQTAENWTQLAKAPLCTAVQASLDRMDLLPNFISSWPGPLSISVFAPGPEFSLTSIFIQYLTYCNVAIKQQVTFHMVFPIDRPPEAAPNMTLSMDFDCNMNSSLFLQTLLNSRNDETIEWRNKMQYPQNLLRNVARSHCQTTFVTCIDIDMVFPHPSPYVQPTIMEQLNAFLSTEDVMYCELCAFVLPIFELDYSVTNVPGNKTELLALKKDDKARQYHIEVFPPNQGLSKLNSKWSKLPPCDGVKIAYSISNFQFWYEPVYIVKRGVPKFDERYIGFGMVRNTQAYEMFLAGYTFHILDNVFLSHWGYQKKKVISRERLKQTNENFKRFVNSHVRELSVKYDQDPLGLLAKYANKRKHFVNVQKVSTISPHLVHTELPKLARRRRQTNILRNRRLRRRILNQRSPYYSRNVTNVLTTNLYLPQENVR